MIGALGFLSPWLLVALAALPLVWLVLRLTPPRPRRVDFPPTRILFGLEDRDTTPARTPWWLTLLRLLLVAVLIAALAEPILRPESRLAAGTGPLLVLVDNGWDAAPDFAERIAAAGQAVEEAKRQERPVALVATAEPRPDGLAPAAAAEAARRLAAIEPRPYLPDRRALAERLAKAYGPGAAEVRWIAGGLDDGGAADLAGVLGRIGAGGILLQSNRPLRILLPPENGVEAIRIPVARLGGAAEATIAGFDEEGRRILETRAAFAAGDRTTVEVALPADLRNALTRLTIAGEASAGAVQLLDTTWRRKSVGLVVGEAANPAQPLLAPLTYVERALQPRADLLRPQAPTTGAAIAEIVKRGASVMVLTETGNLPPETAAAVTKWVEAGGTLVRFASPNLAAGGGLLPVRLRQGERALGGSLSWQEPQPIGAFPAAGPFASIAVPKDVRINRQILAEPEALAGVEIWAELTDGTPLVTARARGAGRIVLFHVTADPRWSNLPLSGAFVEMLTAIVNSARLVDAPVAAASEAAAKPSGAPWRPIRLLDGSGRLSPPTAGAALVADLANAEPSPETPPGFYDRDGTIRAINAVGAQTALRPLDPGRIGWGGATARLTQDRATPLWPYLLAFAAVLAVLDGLAVLALGGRLSSRRLARGAAALLLAVAAFPVTPAGAQQGAAAPTAAEDKALAAALQTRLAYVVTGNDEIDETSRAGLEGLSQYLASRTALEPAEPVGLDLAADELAFYPLIYWPIDAAADVPAPDVLARVDAFLKNGGTILFDTRDGGSAALPGTAAASPETERLRAILGNVDVPPLEPAPPDHVLTKAFYLLTEFPGRWNNSELWVESLSDTPALPGRPARGGDGVSPVLITGNDLAAAWAVADDGSFLYPTVPADPRQRELAFRAGVNIVMYCFTGNYKADQVHIPALLERLGQ